MSAWGDFVESVIANDDVIVYYSGHGAEVNGSNYVVPIDAPGPSSIHNTIALRGALISLSDMMDEIASRAVNVSIWLLDACRDDPFAIVGGKSLSGSGGMNPQFRGNGGVFIFYAASRNQTAIDRLDSDPTTEKLNSLFTRVLFKFMDSEPSIRSVDLAEDVKLSVIERAKHAQRPAFYDELEVPFCFKACQAAVAGDLTIRTSAADVRVQSAALADAAKVVLGLGSSKGLGSSVIPTPTLSHSLSNAVVQEAVKSAPAGLSSVASAQIADALSGNVVFLGRESTSQSCKDSDASDRYPFGCNVLMNAIALDNSLFSKDYHPTTDVNVRLSAPVFSDSSGLRLACVAGRLSPRDSVKFKGIVTLVDSSKGAAPADKLYYAALDGPQRGCLTADRQGSKERAAITIAPVINAPVHQETNGSCSPPMIGVGNSNISCSGKRPILDATRNGMRGNSGTTAGESANPGACEREAEELDRIRANPDRSHAERFARTVTCDALKPQAARLLESFTE